MTLDKYEQMLASTYAKGSILVKYNTPLGICAYQTAEMVSAYLHDAKYFSRENDQVNRLISLGYAHGWLYGAVMLGYMQISLPSLPRSIVLDTSFSKKLHEKKERYDTMLSTALASVCIAPSSGSPLWKTSHELHGLVFQDLVKSRALNKEDALLLLSYAYGGFDFGVRCGLYQIVNHPHLFTTEL
jgi:hypothetical protein